MTTISRKKTTPTMKYLGRLALLIADLFGKEGECVASA